MGGRGAREEPMSELFHSIDAVGNNACVAFIKGTADIATHDQFKKIISEIKDQPLKKVVLDICNLEFLTSLAVGEIVSLNKTCKAAGGKVVIAGPNEYVMGVFKVSRLGDVIPIVDTVEKGVEAVK